MVVTTAGYTHLATFLYGEANFTAKYIGVGTSSAAVAEGQTALGAELATRSLATKSNPSDRVYRCAVTFAAGENTGALTEVGLFTAASSGTMYMRDVFAVQNKGGLDALTVTYSLTFSN